MEHFGYIANNIEYKTDKNRQCVDQYLLEPFATYSIPEPEAVQEVLLTLSTSNFYRNNSRKKLLQALISSITEHKIELLKILVMESGKILADAEREIDSAIAVLNTLMSSNIPLSGGMGNSYWQYKPIGLCLFIIPRNFPIQLLINKIAAAILLGSAFIVKPSPESTAIALYLARLLAKIMPQDSFAILPGNDDLTKTIVNSSLVQVVSFTGSICLGQELQQLSNNKKFILDTLCPTSCIIGEYVELNKIVDDLVRSSVTSNGQSYISLKKLYVPNTKFEHICRLLSQKFAKLKTGDPMAADTELTSGLSPAAVLKAPMELEEDMLWQPVLAVYPYEQLDGVINLLTKQKQIN